MLYELLVVAEGMGNKFNNVSELVQWIVTEGLSDDAFDQLKEELNSYASVATFTPIDAALEEVMNYDYGV